MKPFIRGFLARVLPITSRSLLVLARVKNSTLLSLAESLEMSTMLLLASRGQVELFGEQPTRGSTVSFLSLFLSFFLAFVSPSSPSPLSCSFSFFLSLCVSLSFSLFLSVQRVLLRSAGSFVHGDAASSATSGPGDEEGPSGPIYPRASCDDPVDGFQKYTQAVLN